MRWHLFLLVLFHAMNEYII